MGDRYVKSDDGKKMFYIDSTNFYGWAMSQSLPHIEIKIWLGHCSCYVERLEEILNTPDDSQSGYFLEVELSYPYKIRENTKKLSWLLKIENLILIILHHT